MQAIKETAADLLRDHPYFCVLAGFTATLGYGLAKLAVLVQTL